MIEQALYEHLASQASLCDYLAEYAGRHAIFNQEAPPDTDPNWGIGPQYGRIIYAVDMQGDPARAMGGTLMVVVQCMDDMQYPEDIEPLVRELIHGYFFSNGTFVVAAQWKDTAYYTPPTDKVTECTLTFDLLGFPVLTTTTPDVIERINEWTYNTFAGLHVINYDELPSSAWKPIGPDAAVYWRLVVEDAAGWIPDTFQTIWRTATIRCHIFAETISRASTVARDIIYALYASKRLLRDGETPIMVNRRNTLDSNADALRTGQVTVEATFGVIVAFRNTQMFKNITYQDINNERRTLDGEQEQ